MNCESSTSYDIIRIVIISFAVIIYAVGIFSFFIKRSKKEQKQPNTIE